MSAPEILFVVDAGPEIGGGHVMRSLTLAQALAERGGRCAFVAPTPVATILDAFAGPEIGRVERAQDARCDAVVFDHFRIGATEQAALARGRPALVIDDLANRALHADRLLDVGPARRPEDYAGLLPEGATLLLGPAYALVRPAFAQTRPAALARRGRDEPVGRVLVSLGLTDVGGITGRVVNRLLPRLGEAAVDVVAGSAAPSRAAVERLAERDPRVTLHIDAADMAGLMTRADLAVGAGGSTAWERCTLGLPTLLLVLADNQQPAARALADLGAAEMVDARAPDFEAAIDRAFTGLMRAPERRARLSRASAALCDGLGAGRVAEAFLRLIAERS